MQDRGDPKHQKLVLRDIRKAFGSLVANDGISMCVEKASVHAILGENGAGKSTLMNILYGLYQPDDGEIILDGRRVEIDSPRKAGASGIGMVHQHFMQVAPLTVTENVVLGMKGQGLRLPLREHAQKLAGLSRSLGFEIDPDIPIGKIPIGMQQRVEILKLVYHDADLLILDEPTSVLTPTEIGPFFDVLCRLRESGKTILFITHKLEEVMAIADEVTVMRAGRVVASRKIAETTASELAKLMVGREIALSPRRVAKPGGNIHLELSGLRARNDRGLLALDDIDLTVRAGEILGIAGVDGNGQSELAEVIAGLRTLEGGRVSIAGIDIGGASILDRNRKHGLAYVPEDRHRQGLAMDQSVAFNLILRSFDQKPFSKWGFFNFQAVRDHANRLIRAFGIRLRDADQEIRYLSGGNQQKVILARELESEPIVMIVAQPTKGLDVGAIEFVQSQLLNLRDRGAAILYISTELEHLLDICDRVGVMFRGKLMDVIDRKDATSERLGLLMAGVRREAA